MIELYTAATPNGHKVSIALEELRLPYNVHTLELGKLQQKEAWFLAVNPNGRIPAIVDRDAAGGDLAVFESGAILVYLAEKTGQLLPADTRGRSLVLQWLMFQMGGVGPMQGQLNVFHRYAPERIPYAIERYRKETLRLYDVLNTRLATVAFLAGEYSIADIATWPWVTSHAWSGLSLDGLPHLQRWVNAVGARPAVQKGALIPPPKGDDSERSKNASTILV